MKARKVKHLDPEGTLADNAERIVRTRLDELCAFMPRAADPAEVERSMRGMETSLRNAKLWGADTVLLVPAVVNPQTSYRDALTRSRAQIQKLIPLAKELGVVIAVEEVWNKFLLSPLEFADYVDGFKSKWVQAYFDVGNVVLFGYPQDWIRTLGKRIVNSTSKILTARRASSCRCARGSVDLPRCAGHRTRSSFSATSRSNCRRRRSTTCAKLSKSALTNPRGPVGGPFNTFIVLYFDGRLSSPPCVGGAGWKACPTSGAGLTFMPAKSDRELAERFAQAEGDAARRD